MIWFPFYASNFIGATVDLSCQEVSIYNWMLTLYYELGPFPEDRGRTYRIVRCESDEQRRSVDYLLTRHFVLLEGFWWNEKAERIREEVERRHSEAAQRGKLSAEVRRAKYGTAQPKPREPFESLSKGSGNASELTTTTSTTTSKSKVIGARFALPLLPDDWKTFCKANRPDLNAEATFDAFADYWKAVPGARGCKLDWFATWRNWVRSQRAPTALTPQVKPWHETASGTKAMGAKLGLDPADFCTEDGRQDWQAFAAAVKKKAGVMA